MAINLQKAINFVAALLGCMDGFTDYTALNEDPAHPYAEIKEAVLEADSVVYCEILLNINHGQRNSLLTLSASIPHGTKLPAHIGPIGKIVIQYKVGDADYKPGTRWPRASDIQLWRDNNAGLYAAQDDVAGYWTEEGDLLFYTGNDAKAYLGNYTRDDALCQSPDFTFPTVCAFALSLEAAKDGDDPAVAQHFGNIAQMGLAAIRGNLEEVPALIPPGTPLE